MHVDFIKNKCASAIDLINHHEGVCISWYERYCEMTKNLKMCPNYEWTYVIQENKTHLEKLELNTDSQLMLIKEKKRNAYKDKYWLLAFYFSKFIYISYNIETL